MQKINGYILFSCLGYALLIYQATRPLEVLLYEGNPLSSKSYDYQIVANFVGDQRDQMKLCLATQEALQGQVSSLKRFWCEYRDPNALQHLFAMIKS